jgi:hypothetical protein
MASNQEIVMSDAKKELSLVHPSQEVEMKYLNFRTMLDLAWEQVRTDATPRPPPPSHRPS